MVIADHNALIRKVNNLIDEKFAKNDNSLFNE